MARKPDPSRAAFWRELIERRSRHDLSVSEVCEHAGVSSASFYQWQRKLRAQTSPVRSPLRERGASRLVPVQVVADRPQSSAGELEVELPGGACLRIAAGCDRATLQLVLGLLLAGGSQEGGRC